MANDRCGGRGDTALHVASLHGRLETVKLLVEKGADMEMRSDSDGATPLMRAAEGGHADVALALIEAGADIDCTDSNGRPALHWALQYDGEDATSLSSRASAISCSPIFRLRSRPARRGVGVRTQSAHHPVSPRLEAKRMRGGEIAQPRDD